MSQRSGRFRSYLWAALVDRRAANVTIIPIQEDFVSGEVKGSISEFLHRIQRVNMDEVAIRRTKPLTERCAKIKSLGPDRETGLFLRIINV
ncbi:hypothetical protein SAMN06265221_1427 [Paracoccus laeviglucosivorans]|uniref:Uncharacterized protein n=1 Tax=Paracoccus laeviglucosivorans TaxID=1197861 RepID=A0A521FT06_9RHOB|nr:hypothetical protein SAMN06265221_1427 [Paracoccus laeviglucosivorans]